MSAHPGGHPDFRFVARKRRTKEDRRFVAGRGRFVADVRVPGMKHVALVSSPYPAARIVAIDVSQALAMPGVVGVLTGDQLAAATDPIGHGVPVKGLRWHPLAVGQVRYVGEWVAAVVADDRYVAEDAAEAVEVEYEPLPFVIDPEAAARPDAPLVHETNGTNVVYHRVFDWGDVDADFARAAHTLDARVHWARNSTVPIETFGVAARWDPGTEILDVWASIQMPKFPDQVAAALRLPGNAVRVHYDVDVGGSYGVKRGLKHSILVGHLARAFGVPVRLLEDRLENMSGGDAHGPDRYFDVTLAFQPDGRIVSMKMRAMDDVGCWPGRSPLQLGKPIGAIVGPYTIASVRYDAISVVTNKTSQVPVRGFGQAPTNYALETAVDRVARFLGLDPAEARRRNFIQPDAFPYRIPSGSEYDSGDYPTVLAKAIEVAELDAWTARRDALRAEGRLAGIGVATVLEPGGGNAAFEPLFNPANDTTTWMESCTVRVDLAGTVSVAIATSTSGQGHETLAATVVGEALGIDPDAVRVVHANSLEALPGNSPVASRMAIMLGGAAWKAAQAVKAKVIAIAAHDLGIPAERVVYENGDCRDADDATRRVSWKDVVLIAHRRYHRMPPDMEPGLQAIHTLQVPNGGKMPTEDGRVQMYPCYSFEAHLALVEIDAVTGRASVLDYAIGHDCGTVINPDIVRGMTLGGIAHGIGAALYEKFSYDAESGQHLSGSFVDYLLPSAHEVPTVRYAEHCTPSPLTVLGQKGAGEAGYLGAPACVANAVNDALAPLGAEIMALPMSPAAIEAAIARARGTGQPTDAANTRA